MSASDPRSGTHSELAFLRLSDAPRAFLHDFYVRILQPTFPPEGRQPLESMLRSPGGSTDGVLACEGRERGGRPGAEHFVGGTVQLLAYLAVDPSRRARGLGSRLLAEGLSTSESELVLAEIEDPRFWPTTTTSDPEARLRFWARTGSRLLPVPYVQPSLQAGLQRVHHLLLIAVPRPGLDPIESVPGPLVAAFLREYFERSEGSVDAEDADVARLLEACVSAGSPPPVTARPSRHPLLTPFGQAGVVTLPVRALRFQGDGHA